MPSELETLRKQLQETERLYEEDRRFLEEAKRLRKEDRHLREEAEHLREEAEHLRRLREETKRLHEEAEHLRRLREETKRLYERRTGKSTLPEFLNAHHTHFYLSLAIQPDSTQSTQDDPSNAKNKPSPDRMPSELETLRKQLQEAERLREEAERLREEDRHHYEEDRHHYEEDRHHYEEDRHHYEEDRHHYEEDRHHYKEDRHHYEEDRHHYERRTGKSTLPEFLDAHHTHFYPSLAIQPDSIQSTQGDASNAKNKSSSDRMSSELETLRKQLQEAEQLREEAERLREEDRHHYERRTGKSTLPESLDACHTHLYSGLAIQPDNTQSTQGDPSNAKNKPRPDRILPWVGFDTEQAHIWEGLMESSFVLERHFTSLHTLEELGEAERRRQMGSELDLNNFARFTVKDPVSQIIERLSKDEVLRDRFRLKGSVTFENHSNTLSPDRAAEEIQSLNIAENPRRSTRLRANVNNPGRGAAEATQSSRTTQPSRPRADQFCVYNISGANEDTKQRVAALTIEYKAPHKLTLGHIYEGLGEMELDEVVKVGKKESVAIRCRRLVAAVITQGFSYMVRAGLQYGEIYTGEATIFLRIPEDPSTVYYSLSVPKGDVGPLTDWSERGDQPNRLHLTALGQAVAFTLRALQTPPRDANWRAKAERQLKTWNVEVKDTEEAIADDEVPSSEYRPSYGANSLIIRSPIQFRPRKKKSDVATCASAPSSFSSNDDNPPDIPSRPSQPPNSSGSRTSANPTAQTSENSGQQATHSSGHHQRNLGRFCTPQCLMGVIQGGALDQKCPNVKEHGKAHHHLNRESFMQKARQLLRDQLDYCEEMNIHGARGALFKVKLPIFGYTVVAKATGVECVEDLMHESAIYRRLLPIQGKYVPVHLGDIKVDNLLYYAGAVRIVHMMFLSFGGFPIRSPIPTTLADEAIRGLQAIHQLGVLQKDPAARNILVHPDRPGMTWIDFERAAFLPPRVALKSLSGNRKGKFEIHDGVKFHEKSGKASAEEIVTARAELSRLGRIVRM